MDVLDLATTIGLAALVVVVGILAFRVSNPPEPAPPPGQVGVGDVADDVARLLAAVPSASVVLDADDRVVRATPAAYALGVARASALALPELVALVSEVRRDGGWREVQLNVSRGSPPGAVRLVLRIQVIALAAGRVLVLAEDRTASLRLDQVRRDFVANVSHELKTPVGAIALLAETLADAADDPEAVTHFAGRLGVEADRLAGLVQDIIDLSRLQDATSTSMTEPVPIAEVVAEAVARCEVEANARDIEVAAQVIGSPEVFGDRSLLVTAVRNLVDNALRYSDGGTRVTVVARAVDETTTQQLPARRSAEEPGAELTSRASTARSDVGVQTDGLGPGLVEISVIDQGIGMDPAVLPRVFERFYRVDPARSRETGGTGLGLSIVKHIAADHGGEVVVWSQLGRGSTFTLRLPLAEHPGGDAPPSTDQTPPTGADGSAVPPPTATPTSTDQAPAAPAAPTAPGRTP